MTLFLSGITCATFGASALFFLRFWRASHDRFYLFFAIACGLLAADRILLLSVPAAACQAVRSAEFDSLWWLYGVRLVAFIVIFIGIGDKKRAAR